MTEYLFIPWNPMDAIILSLEGGPDRILAEFKKRARASNQKAMLFIMDKGYWRGLKLLYHVVDRQLYNGAGDLIGAV